MIKGHKEFNNEIWFAGGTWTWTGFAAQNKHGICVTDSAMRSCFDNNIENIIITQWKDNGGECSFYSSLPVLFYASRVIKNITDIKQIKREFFEIMGIRFDDFIKFDLINETENEPYVGSVINPSKYMLYNDPFLGIYDCTVVEGESCIYKKYAKMYQNLKKKMPNYSYLCEYYKSLSEFLFYKFELGNKTRKFYQDRNIEALSSLIKDYDLSIKHLKNFIKAFRNLWYIENKPHGFDVQEIRLGGLLMRLESCKERLIQFIRGDIVIIAELEEDILDFDGVSEKNHRKNNALINSYQLISTVNIL